MIPFKKTYLIKLEELEHYENDGGVYIINPSLAEQESWKGTVEAYGAGWTEEEKKDLVPIGAKIVMSYGKNTSDRGGIKLTIHKKNYVIRDGKEILGVIEDE